MYRNASEFFTHNHTLSSVNPSANFNAEFLHGVGNRLSAADSTCRTIKSRQKTIARRVDFSTAVPPELLADKQVMLGQ
jgi:hypothetical protein